MSCLHCLLQLFQQQLRTALIGIQSIPAAMIGKCAVIQLYDSIFFSQRLLRKYIDCSPHDAAVLQRLLQRRHIHQYRSCRIDQIADRFHKLQFLTPDNWGIIGSDATVKGYDITFL